MPLMKQAPTALLAALLLLSSSWFGCTHTPVVQFDTTSQALAVRHAALYPETIEYDAKKDVFLLGSFREGAIYEVDHTGSASLLVDDSRLCSVLGIALDARHGKLWAVNSDLGASAKPSLAGPKQLAAVGIYDRSSGKALGYVDLAPLSPGPHLLNGITLDSAGNAYVTDSFSPTIFRIDADGHPSSFVHDQRFEGAGINLNGIVAHPDGFLLVVKKSDGALFKIPLAQPTQLTRVAVGAAFVGGDGLTLIGKKNLVVIANRTPSFAANIAYALSSNDDWVTAKVVATQPLGDAYATTSVLRNDTLYVVQSQLNQLIALPPPKQTELRVEAAIRPIARVLTGASSP
jgi:hypothetical protein